MRINNIDSDKSYLLLACGFRSGAALCSSIINTHSKISFSADIIKYLNFCYARYPVISSASLQKLLKELQLRISIRFSVSIDIDVCMDTIGNNIDHKTVYLAVMNTIYAHDKNSTILGECEGLAWSKIPYYLDNIPNSKAMIIARDPRDVLVSFKKNTIATGSDYLVSVFNCVGLMEAWLDYESKYKNRFLGIRFEELKYHDVCQVRRITNFLNVEFEQDMLNSKHWTKLGENGWVPWENHDSSSFSDNRKQQMNPVGRWRSIIDPVDHYICEWIAGDVMTKFNIELEFDSHNRNIFDEALNRLMSSDLLRSCLYEYMNFGRGSEKYPLDPTNPTNWDRQYIDNLSRLSELG